MHRSFRGKTKTTHHFFSSPYVAAAGFPFWATWGLHVCCLFLYGRKQTSSSVVQHKTHPEVVGATPNHSQDASLHPILPHTQRAAQGSSCRSSAFTQIYGDEKKKKTRISCEIEKLLETNISKLGVMLTQIYE